MLWKPGNPSAPPGATLKLAFENDQHLACSFPCGLWAVFVFVFIDAVLDQISLLQRLDNAIL